MKNKILLAFVLVFFTYQAFAQQSIISLGPEINIPSGNSSNISSIGLGGFVKAEIGLSQKFGLTATGSLASFFGKKFLGVRSQTLTYLPVRVGLKYYRSENFYFEGMAGLAFPIGGSSKTAFTWSPGLGTLIKTGGSGKFDIGLRFEAQTSTVQYIQTSTKYSSYSYIGLRFGYVFGL